METETTSKSTSSQRSGSSIEKKSRAAAEADIQHAWQEASEAIQTLYSQATVKLEETVRERPYVALAAAAGIGFVLGGGLRSLSGRYLLRTTAQVVIPGVVAALRGEEA